MKDLYKLYVAFKENEKDEEEKIGILGIFKNAKNAEMRKGRAEFGNRRVFIEQGEITDEDIERLENFYKFDNIRFDDEEVKNMVGSMINRSDLAL